MTIYDRIRDEKLQCDLTKKLQKCQHYHQVKLINTNILQVKKHYLMLKNKKKNKVNLFMYQLKWLLRNKQKLLKIKEINKLML